ncbi:MAG: acireductone synthase [Methylococcus sp.]|nr:MAG: acireductone synthase [Methylococcus sp.]
MIRAILTDIEGTTSSLSFVKDILFPYARQRLRAFIDAHGQEPAVARELTEVARLAGGALTTAEAADQLIAWIDEDRKATPLKALQGMIWETGYRQRDFFGHIYEDAARQLRAWQAAGLRLCVFSSGSVQAQKLLFAHTEFGDLTPLFYDYFDTRIGPKQEPDAYRAIAEAIGLPPGDILFLSDIEGELEAARAAGMATTRLVREDGPAPVSHHPLARNFDEIAPSR